MIKDFGVQLTQTRMFGAQVVSVSKPFIPVPLIINSMQFLERERIISVFIHEYIQGSSVHFCIAYKLQDRNDLVVSFAVNRIKTQRPGFSLIFVCTSKSLYPGLHALKSVLRAYSEYSTKYERRNHNA